MNKKVGELLWKVAEVAVLAIVGSLATKAGDSLGEKIDKKVSDNKQVSK